MILTRVGQLVSQMVGNEHVSMIPAAPSKVWNAEVNGQQREVLVPSNAVLLDVLRDKTGCLGVKRGCDMGHMRLLHRYD